MADITGMLDIPDSPPDIRVLPSGSVLLALDDVSLRFRSLRHFDAWCERLDRRRAAMGWSPTLDEAS